MALPLLAELAAKERPGIDDYSAASAEYIRAASGLGSSGSKSAQIGLSKLLARVTVASLADRGIDVRHMVAGEREVGGGLRSVKADVSEVSLIDGLRLAVEIKPVHLAVGRAIWNRFGDIRTFAVNIHLKFPFAVVGGILTVPTEERLRSGVDSEWRPTSEVVSRAVGRFMRAGGRRTEGDAPHLLEGIAVVAFDPRTGLVDRRIPPPGSGLRWEEFVAAVADTYGARFGDA